MYPKNTKNFLGQENFSQRINGIKMETEYLKSKSIHTTQAGKRGRNGRTHSRSFHGMQHGDIDTYDDDEITVIKSPVLPSITESDDNLHSQNMIMSASKRGSKFTIYEPVISTPKMISKSEDDEFMRKLGQRNANVGQSPKINSPVYHSPQSVRDYYSPTYSHKSLSPRSDSGGINYDQFYKPKGKDRHTTQVRNSSDKEVIELLKQQLEDNRRLLDAFLEKEKRKEATPQRTQEKDKRKPKAVYSVPKDETPTPEKSKTPDYESMDPEETEKYEAKFRNNFKLLQESYPGWGIEVPNIGEISLRSVHEIYEEIVETIIIYQNAMKFRVLLVLAFAGVEYYFYKVKKIRAFKNFCKVQIKSLSKYNVYLLNFSKSLHKRGGEEWPQWMNFITNILTSLFSFVTIQGAANAMGWSAPESILHEANKFVSPDHGPAKLKSDGISEVPVKPTGWQDPNYIIKEGLNLWEGIEETQAAMNGEANVAPVKAKPIEVGKYDDVFE